MTFSCQQVHYPRGFKRSGWLSVQQGVLILYQTQIASYTNPKMS